MVPETKSRRKRRPSAKLLDGGSAVGSLTLATTMSAPAFVLSGDGSAGTLIRLQSVNTPAAPTVWR